MSSLPLDGSLPLGAFIAHMSGADVFGLVVSILVIAIRSSEAGYEIDDGRLYRAGEDQCSDENEHERGEHVAPPL
jgi:hypothetical protein